MARLFEISARLALSMACAAALCPPPAWGHHGFDGRYDVSRPIWIEGQVTRAYFGQPHAVISISAAANLGAPPAHSLELGGVANVIDARRIRVDPAYRGRVVRVELPPTSPFFGLSRSVRVGTRVAVLASRNCEAPHQLYAHWVRPAGGRPVRQSVRMRFMVEGC